MRTVKQSSVVRETENGEEGEEETAEFGEEDLFHQQVKAPRWQPGMCAGTRMLTRAGAHAHLAGSGPGCPAARRRGGLWEQCLASGFLPAVWTSGSGPGPPGAPPGSSVALRVLRERALTPLLPQPERPGLKKWFFGEGLLRSWGRAAAALRGKAGV